jgi:hypothetical protein
MQKSRLEGATLKHLINDHAIDLDLLLEVAIEVTEGLDAVFQSEKSIRGESVEATSCAISTRFSFFDHTPTLVT